MKRGFSWLATGWLALAMLLAGATAQGAGEFEAALANLRERGLYQEALDQLAAARADANYPAELKRGLPYEEAQTLIEWADSDPQLERRGPRLDDAQARLEKFLAAEPKHPLFDAANLKLAEAHTVRATTLMELADLPSRKASALELTAKGRQDCDRAREILEATLKRLEARLKELPTGRLLLTNETYRAERDRVRYNILEGNSRLARVLGELADIEQPGTPAHRAALRVAAEQWKTIYQRWSTLNLGQQALFSQANCLQLAGDLKEAIAAYGKLADVPASTPQKAPALARLLRCLLDPAQPDAVEAEKRGSAWLAEAKDEEKLMADGLAIRFYTALAQAMLASKLPADQTERREALVKQAREHADRVVRSDSVHRDSARWLLGQIGKDDGPIVLDELPNSPPPAGPARPAQPRR